MRDRDHRRAARNDEQFLQARQRLDDAIDNTDCELRLEIWRQCAEGENGDRRTAGGRAGRTDHGRHCGGQNRAREGFGLLLSQTGNQVLREFMRLDVVGIFELTPEPCVDREGSTDVS